MAKDVVFEFGYAQTNESLTFKFVGFPAITYTCIFYPPAGAYQYLVNFGGWDTAGPQVAMAVQARMQTDIGADYTIERQGRRIRITKNDDADLESASVNKTNNSYFNYVADPSGTWDYDDLAFVDVSVSGSSITVSASSTNRPLEFQVNDGDWLAADTENPAGTFVKVFHSLSPGTYLVSVRDGFDVITQQVSLLALSVSVAKTNVLCHGASTGAIVLTPSNGVEPYSYSWADGPTTKDRSSLPAGNYQVTVTDANNDTEIIDIEITQPPDLVVTGVVTGGSIDVSVSGGVAPYSYAWADGPTSQDRTLLNAGDYTITVTDANGCTQQETFTVTQLDPLNTGYKAWSTLEQYRTDTNAAVGVEKANDPEDSDYIAPEYNPTDCPLP